VIARVQYDPDYGDEKVCTCGHTYYRHHDSYEGMLPVGCKYCGSYDCEVFTPAEGLPPVGPKVYSTDLHSAWKNGFPTLEYGSYGYYLLEFEQGDRFVVGEFLSVEGEDRLVDFLTGAYITDPVIANYPIPNPHLKDDRRR